MLSDNLLMPGPGTYDLNFKEELKTLDHQLSLRYQTNPFGSNRPRFNRNKIINKKKNKQQIAINTTHQAEQEKHKKAELIYKYVKEKDAAKHSYIFSSQTPRFEDDSIVSPPAKI